MDLPLIDLSSDDFLMGEALRQARRAAAAEETPIGAVIAYEGRVIARAYNQVETLTDATAHAEMLAISQAQEVLSDWRLTGCVIYVTKEPCPMCAGALVLARLDRVVFAAADPKGGGAGGRFNIVQDPNLNHHASVTAGVREAESVALLQGFFRERRALAKELKQRRRLGDPNQ